MNPTMTSFPARLARCAGFGMGMRIGGAVKTFAR
jgi:hypothetical protein